MSVELVGVRVAFKVTDFPFARVTFVLFNFTFVAGTFTVTLQVAFFPLEAVAVMVAVPALTPLILPFAVTEIGRAHV